MFTNCVTYHLHGYISHVLMSIEPSGIVMRGTESCTLIQIRYMPIVLKQTKLYTHPDVFRMHKLQAEK